jgi:hypothetical protein
MRIGRVARCSKGRLGLITGRKQLAWGLSYVGIGLDDGTMWASRDPEFLGVDEVAGLVARDGEPLRNPSAP